MDDAREFERAKGVLSQIVLMEKRGATPQELQKLLTTTFDNNPVKGYFTVAHLDPDNWPLDIENGHLTDASKEAILRWLAIQDALTPDLLKSEMDTHAAFLASYGVKTLPQDSIYNQFKHPFVVAPDSLFTKAFQGDNPDSVSSFVDPFTGVMVIRASVVQQAVREMKEQRFGFARFHIRYDTIHELTHLMLPHSSWLTTRTNEALATLFMVTRRADEIMKNKEMVEKDPGDIWQEAEWQIIGDPTNAQRYPGIVSEKYAQWYRDLRSSTFGTLYRTDLTTQERVGAVMAFYKEVTLIGLDQKNANAVRKAMSTAFTRAYPLVLIRKNVMPPIDAFFAGTLPDEFSFIQNKPNVVRRYDDSLNVYPNLVTKTILVVSGSALSEQQVKVVSQLRDESGATVIPRQATKYIDRNLTVSPDVNGVVYLIDTNSETAALEYDRIMTEWWEVSPHRPLVLWFSGKPTFDLGPYITDPSVTVHYESIDSFLTSGIIGVEPVQKSPFILQAIRAPQSSDGEQTNAVPAQPAGGNLFFDAIARVRNVLVNQSIERTNEAVIEKTLEAYAVDVARTNSIPGDKVTAIIEYFKGRLIDTLFNQPLERATMPNVVDIYENDEPVSSARKAEILGTFNGRPVRSILRSFVVPQLVQTGHNLATFDITGTRTANGVQSDQKDIFGDYLIYDVVAAIQDELGPDYLVVRTGGDEITFASKLPITDQVLARVQFAAAQVKGMFLDKDGRTVYQNAAVHDVDG